MRQNNEMKVATPIISKKMMWEHKGQKRRQIYRFTLAKLLPALLGRIARSSWDRGKVGTAGAWLSGCLLLQWGCSSGGLLHKTSSPSLEAQAGAKSLFLC